MNTNFAGSIAIQIHQARDRLAESEARAFRLAATIDRIGGHGPQARALAEAMAIVNDLVGQQRSGVASLEASERAGLSNYLEATLAHELRHPAPAAPSANAGKNAT